MARLQVCWSTSGQNIHRDADQLLIRCYWLDRFMLCMYAMYTPRFHLELLEFGYVLNASLL